MPVKDQKQLCSVRYNHCKRHHEGEGLPGHARRQEDYVVPIKDERQAFFWKCQWCKCGVRKAVAEAASSVMIERAIRAHLNAKHPKKTKQARQQAHTAQKSRVLKCF